MGQVDRCQGLGRQAVGGRWWWGALLFMAGCGPDWVLVDYTFTLANLSSYDFVDAVVCFDALDEVECVTYDSGIASGVTGSGSATFLAAEGDALYVAATAIDVDGDGYLWERDYLIAGSTLDVAVVFTDEHCCWDF